MTGSRHIRIILLSMVIMLLPLSVTRGTINSVVLTPDNPTVLSNGLGYYLAGKTYNFAVNVIDPDLAGWGQITYVTVTIPNSTNIVLTITPSGTGANLPVTVTSGTVDAVADVAGTYNNFTVTFKVTFRWDTPESAWAASRNVTASARTSYPAVNTRTDSTKFVSYGVCSSIKILNFAQDGVAADGYVNPWHDSFAVSGRIVYNVTGATASDALQTVDAGEILGSTLYIDGGSTGLTEGAGDDNVSYTVAPQYISTLSTVLGAHTWRVRVTMATAGGPESSSNNLTLTCDRVEITGITFVNGGGVDSPAYYRSVNVPGTQVQVSARMQNGLGAMVGNTTITLVDITSGDSTTVQINSGQTSGTANLTYPTATPVPATSSRADTYQVQSVTGGAYGGDTAPNGQRTSGNIQQVANPTINWDNAHPPGGASVPFTAWVGLSQTAYSLTFNWTALASGFPHGDFYSYRVYYRTSAIAAPPTPAGPWLILDRNTTGFSALGTIGTGTVTVTNLSPITNYDFYITAVDVFGNETLAASYLPATPYLTASTLASSITVSLSDGITSYDDNSFTSNPAASARSLRRANIRVNAFIVGVGFLPDSVNIIAAPDGVADLVTAGVLNGVAGADYYRFSTAQTGTNQWSGYITDSSPVNAVGSNVRFILELVRSGAKSYADHDSEKDLPPGDPNNYPWRFGVTAQPTFTPWPTRVLNNVITRENPVAYPAYYLADDAYVTIKAYDIKGRPVATLLDNAYRKGGINIKEGGWEGVNRSNNRLGVGLYYLHFEARRASDGRKILNSFQKVVVAR